MQWDESEDTNPLEGLIPAGWRASHPIVSHQVQSTLQEAVRIANAALDKPSEQTVMQIFQAMIDRTTFQDHTSTSMH